MKTSTKYVRNECKQKWLPGGQIMVFPFRCLSSIFVLLLFVTFSILELDFSCDGIVESKSTDDVDSCWYDMFCSDLCSVAESIFTANFINYHYQQRLVFLLRIFGLVHESYVSSFVFLTLRTNLYKFPKSKFGKIYVRRSSIEMEETAFIHRHFNNVSLITR